MSQAIKTEANTDTVKSSLFKVVNESQSSFYDAFNGMQTIRNLIRMDDTHVSRHAIVIKSPKTLLNSVLCVARGYSRLNQLYG
jgi:hypothetical protein